ARGQRVVPRSADRAEQNGVRFEASVERGCRERAALKLNGGSADRAFGELELVAASVGRDAQNAHGLLGHFRPDAVAGQNSNLQFHLFKPFGRANGAARFGSTTDEARGPFDLDKRLEPNRTTRPNSAALCFDKLRARARGRRYEREQVLIVDSLLAVGKLREAA